MFVISNKVDRKSLHCWIHGLMNHIEQPTPLYLQIVHDFLVAKSVQKTSFPKEGAATPQAMTDTKRWRHQKNCSKCITAGSLKLWFMCSWSPIWRILNQGGRCACLPVSSCLVTCSVSALSRSPGEATAELAGLCLESLPGCLCMMCEYLCLTRNPHLLSSFLFHFVFLIIFD